MSYQDVYNKTYEYVKDLKNTEEYQELLELKKEIDIKLKSKVDNFNALKEKLEECKKYGKYHPDLKKIQQELSEAKASLFNEHLVKRYKELEKTLEENLNSVVTNICKKVSSKIRNSNITGDIKAFIKSSE